MKKIKKILERLGRTREGGERGVSLPFALVAVMIGTFLLVPLLRFMLSRHATAQIYRSVLEARYANDADIEYVIQRLKVDQALREALLDQRGSPLAVDMPAPVNAITPTVEAVLVNPVPWPWAMWAGSQVNIEGNNSIINGGVHSNGTVTVSGNNTVITGTASAGNAVVITGKGVNITGGTQEGITQTWPVSWDINDFKPGGTWAKKASDEGKYYFHSGNWAPSKKEDLPSGLHYATGNVVINSSNVVWDKVTIVAEGTIQFSQTANKDNLISPYVPGLVLFSNSSASNAIYIDANKFQSSGAVVYAPNGTIELAGNKTKFVGAFVANTIIVSKNTLYTEVPFEMSVPETCSIYDIRAISRERTAVARVRYCEDNIPVVSAWWSE